MIASTTSAESPLSRLGKGILVAVFWIAVWYGLSDLINQILLIPSPTEVAVTLWHLIITLSFWKAVGLSLLRISTGFAAAVLTGTLLAILTCWFPMVHRILSPLLHIIRAAPVASFIILALVWIRTDWVPVVIAFLMVLPIIWISVAEGIRQTDRSLLEMAAVYRFGTVRTIRLVYRPSVFPYFLSACATGLGFAWKSGIAAEVICRPGFSIGRQLQNAKSTLETPEVFAWTAVVVLLSLLLEKVLKRLASRMKRGNGAC